MPWPTYSVRMLEGGGISGIWFKNVPPARRWVIKTITCSNMGTEECGFGLYIGGAQVFYARIPVAGATINAATFLVAYQNERVQVNVGKGSAYMTANGFELLDAQNTVYPPAAHEELPVDAYEAREWPP